MAIIGNGDVASALVDRDGFVFFASGVSNSKETRESEYKREKDLLLKQDKTKHLVYFGSLAIFYSDTRYTRHKLEMEEMVKKHFKHYTIVRLGNITWGSNPHTIINNLRDKVKKGKSIVINDGYRYIIEKDEFQHWIKMIPERNCEMNITGIFMTILEMVEKYVRK